MRPAVVDGHSHGFVVIEVGDQGPSAKRQFRMGGGEFVLVKNLAAGGHSTVQPRPVPTGLAGLIVGARVQRHTADQRGEPQRQDSK